MHGGTVTTSMVPMSGQHCCQCRGFDANINTLDDVSQKTCSLWRLGLPKDEIVAGVEMFQDIRWSSVTVEQGHGSAAVLHRVHKQYGLETLRVRSCLHSCLPLLAGLRGQWSEKTAITRRQEALNRKCPRRLSGRAVFFRDIMAAVTAQSEDRAAQGRSIMQMHAALWEKLSVRERQDYHRRAAQEAEVVLDDVSAELSSIELHTSASKTNKQPDAVLRLSSCSLDKVDFEQMLAMAGSSDFSRSRVARLRQEAGQLTEEPPKIQQDRLAAVVIDDALPARDSPANWCSIMALYRDTMRGCVVQMSSGGPGEWFFFLFALQNPRHVSFLKVRYDSTYAHPFCATPLEWFESNNHWDHVFSWKLGDVWHDRQLARDGYAPVAVISPAVFVSEQFLCSHADPLSWEDSVASLPSLPKENKHEGERVAEPATASIPDLEFLEDYLNPGPSAAAASSSSSL